MILKSTFRWLPTVLLSALTGVVAQARPAPAASADHQTFLRQHRANHLRTAFVGRAPVGSNVSLD